MSDEEFGDDNGFGDDWGDDDAGFGGGDDEFGAVGDNEGFDDGFDAQQGFGELPETEAPVKVDPEPAEPEAEAADDGAAEAESASAPKDTGPKINGEKSGWMKILITKKSMLTIGKKTWKERWFVLKDGKLAMKPSPGSKVKEQLDLSQITSVEKDSNRDGGGGERFTIVTKTSSFFFFTRSNNDCDLWTSQLRHAKDTFYKANLTLASNSAMLF